MAELQRDATFDEVVSVPVHTPFATENREMLGRTLVHLLDEASELNPNPRAFNQLRGGRWESLSTDEFRIGAQEFGLGLEPLGLERGEHVAFFTESDISFCLPDMACLLAGLVTVPIYLTHAPDNIHYILKAARAKALVVTDAQLYARIEGLLDGTQIHTVIFMEGEPPAAREGLQFHTAAQVRELGAQRIAFEPGAAQGLRDRLDAQDLATIIYTSGTTGTPKGVMLTHENISSNAIASFSALEGFERGAQEVVLSFLPLTHIFARTLQYGMMWYGNSVYYTDPDSLSEHFREVRPTLIASVPRVLERAYERILQRGEELTGAKRALFDWSVALAGRFDVENRPRGANALQYRVADRLVYSKWREALGGRLRFVIVGAAALRPELVNIFGAAGVNVLQGYGLTETSPVICFNRAHSNRPGTVGLPIDGVEVKVGEQGEILTRGPHVMRGYYEMEGETAKAMKDGWFHTGDVGSIDGDGYITLTGRLKNLFKLSTGKYVMPQGLEGKLEASTLIDYALVVGEGEKYCSALLFLNPEEVQKRSGGGPLRDELETGELGELVRSAVAAANEGEPQWSTVKRVAVTTANFTIENGYLTPTLKVRRKNVLDDYGYLAEAIYKGTPLESSDECLLDVSVPREAAIRA